MGGVRDAVAGGGGGGGGGRKWGGDGGKDGALVPKTAGNRGPL